MKKMAWLSLLLALCLVLTGCGKSDNTSDEAASAAPEAAVPAAAAAKATYIGSLSIEGSTVEAILTQDGNHYKGTLKRDGITYLEVEMDYAWGQDPQKVRLTVNGEDYQASIEEGQVRRVITELVLRPAEGVQILPGVDVVVLDASNNSYTVNYSESALSVTVRGYTTRFSRDWEALGLQFTDAYGTRILLDKSKLVVQEDCTDSFSGLTAQVTDNTLSITETYEDHWDGLQTTKFLDLIRGEDTYTLRSYEDDGSFLDIVMQKQQ